MNRAFQRNSRVEAAPLNDEAILFDPNLSKFFMLNRTSSFIWEHLSTPATPESLAEEICKAFENVSPTSALHDVQETLAQMLAMELVVANDGP